MTSPKRSDLAGAKRVLDAVPPAMRMIRQELRSHATPELTVPQFRVLVHCARRSRSNGELAELQGVSRSAMSRMVDALLDKGLVTRESSSTDSRSVDIGLTDAGRAAYGDMRQGAQRRLSQVLGTFDADEKRRLLDGLEVLERIVAAYDSEE